MANLKPLMNKMLLALNLKGKKYSLGQFQVYSKKAGRMINKYTLSENNPGQKPYRIYEAWSVADIVRFLAGELKKVGDTCD